MNELQKAIVMKVVVLVILVIAAYFMVIRPILRRVGVIETSEDKKRDKDKEQLGTKPDSPFSPSYWKTIEKPLLTTKALAEKLADQIDNAIGNFYDDENEVYGALRQLKSKTQLSWLADIFFQRHGMDLFQLLNRNLGDEEMDVVMGIANELP